MGIDPIRQLPPLTPLARHQQQEPFTAQPNAVAQQDIVVVKRGRGRPPKKPNKRKSAGSRRVVHFGKFPG
jgi:hypothetical protein